LAQESWEPFMTRIVHFLVASCCLPLFVGCAHYEYDLVHPPEVTQHIGTKANVNVTLGPLYYVLRAYDNYLVMQIYNQTDVPIRLLGDRSYVVDPKTQSHPLRNQTIAPHSFIKLIFPPPPSAAYVYGPAIGYGYGYGYGWGWGYRRGYFDPYWNWNYDYGPQYVTVYNYSDLNWEWTGDTEVSITLTFQQGDDKPFSQQFVFRQKTVR
jgi:hypothetical protein